MIQTFVKKVVFFGLFAGASYVLLLCAGTPFFLLAARNAGYRVASQGFLQLRLKELPSYGKVDVLFLGSSHAYRGFDTRIFDKAGIRAFNLGSSSQTPIQTELLLKRYLDMLQPALVVYEVYPGGLQSDGVESAVDLIASDRVDLETVKMAFLLGHMKVYNTLIYALSRDLLPIRYRFKNETGRGDDDYVSGGFIEKGTTYFDPPVEYPQKEWLLREDQLRVFEKILHDLKARGIEVLLVMAPVTPEYYQSYTNNEQVSGYLENLCGHKALCRAYYNFNQVPGWDSRLHFYDNHHLNQAGVVAFNGKLVHILNTVLRH